MNTLPNMTKSKYNYNYIHIWQTNIYLISRLQQKCGILFHTDFSFLLPVLFFVNNILGWGGARFLYSYFIGGARGHFCPPTISIGGAIAPVAPT